MANTKKRIKAADNIKKSQIKRSQKTIKKLDWLITYLHSLI